jgi:hypothetical protein
MKHRLLIAQFLWSLLGMFVYCTTSFAQPAIPVVIRQDGLAGVHNFRVVVLDAERFAAMFGGDTLNFTFQPTQLLGTPYVNDTYTSEVIVRSTLRDTELMRFYVDYGRQTSDHTDSLGLAPDGAIIAGPLDSGYLTHYRWEQGGGAMFVNGRGVRRQVTGSFTGSVVNPIYGTSGIFDDMFTVAFDYALEQFGDSLRFGHFGDTLVPYQKPIEPFIVDGGSDVNLIAKRQHVGQTVPSSSYQPVPGIGQIQANVEFLPGGSENITFEKRGKSYTFPVEYLTIRVRNNAVYRYDTVVYKYSHEFAPDSQAQIKLDTTVETTTLAQTISPGNYALYAYGWFNRPADSSFRHHSRLRACYELLG